MKAKVITVSIIVILIIILTNVTYAASGTVEFKSTIEQVKKGDTFTVTLSATSEDGINGIDTKYVYDSNKLELISENVVDSTKWSNLGVSPSITVICNSTQSIKNADIYALKFKVKDNVADGESLNIETTGILLDTDLQTDSELTIPAKKIEIAVVGNAQEASDGNSKESEQEKIKESQGNSNKSDNKEIKTINTTSTTTNNTNQADKTVAVSVLPKTGKSIIIFTCIVIAIITSIVFYKKYIEYKNIK